jgi:hypothetical protein
MAIRTKTIEYALQSSNTSVAASTIRTFDPLMVYIPETGSRSFRSCFLEVNFTDYATAATSQLGTQFFYRVGTGTAATQSNLAPITNTGEHMSFVHTADVTPAFVSGYGASNLSQSFRFYMSSSAVATTNANARLYCTYDYNDAVRTRIKTVTIPMDSNTGSVLASGSGTFIDTIPALDTYLPEANKIYRDISIEFAGNDFVTLSGSNVQSCSFTLDNLPHGLSGSGPIFTTQVSARYCKYIWNLNWINTSTTHSVFLKSTRAGTTYDCISAKLIATYEYDHENSGKIMNCVALAAADEGGFMGGNLPTNKSKFSREFYVQEPNVTMSRCGIYHSFVDSGAVTFFTAVTQSFYSQSVRSYAFPAVVTCGGWMMGTRFDTGSFRRQGMNLVRGKNTLTNEWYRTGTTAGTLGSNYSAIAFLNYESSKSVQPGGDANHAQIRRWFFSPLEIFAVRTIRTASISMASDSGSYWLSALGLNLYTYQSLAGGNVTVNINATGSDEGDYGEGWEQPFAGTYTSDAEIGPVYNITRMRDIFRRYPGAPNTSLLIPTRNRFYSIDSSNAIGSTGHFFATYYNISYTLTGSISGSTGDGSGVTVTFFRSDTDEEVANTTTVTGGSFTKTYYDNTIPLYAVARQDDTHVGRSANSTASGVP